MNANSSIHSVFLRKLLVPQALLTSHQQSSMYNYPLSKHRKKQLTAKGHTAPLRLMVLSGNDHLVLMVQSVLTWASLPSQLENMSFLASDCGFGQYSFQSRLTATTDTRPANRTTSVSHACGITSYQGALRIELPVEMLTVLPIMAGF